MADGDVNPSPLRKRKVEGFGSSASDPNEICVWDSGSEDEMDSVGEEYSRQNRQPDKVGAFGSSASDPNDECVWDSESDDDLDLDQKKEFVRQFRESNGFDISLPFSCFGVVQLKGLGTSEDPIDLTLYGRLGLHCYNIQKETNLQLERLEKCNIKFISFGNYYITLEAMDPVSGSLYTFQTLVTDLVCRNNEQMRTETEICRLKPTTPGSEISGLWDDRAVDDFYKGDMPNWFSTIDKLQGCYEVPEQDLCSAGDDGLGLYCEFALYRKVRLGKCSWEAYRSFMPLEMKQAYVQTRDNVKPVWKAKNAIFYISFSPCGSAVEYKAIVRKTMDGQLGNLRLETVLLGT